MSISRHVPEHTENSIGTLPGSECSSYAASGNLAQRDDLTLVSHW
jgi:hypothetical protein